MEIKPEECWKKIKIQYRLTFLSAIIFGIVSQGMGMFNKFSYHDDMKRLFEVGHTYDLGRWMLGVLETIESKIYGMGHYSLPIVNGLFSIVCIACAACLIVDLLRMENEILCIFVGGIMTCFPVVTSMFGYMFTVHFYMAALLMGVSGAYLICKYSGWRTAAAGVVLMGCSVGIYQAFIPLILCVMLFSCIERLDREDDLRSWWKKTGRVAIAAAAFILFYFVVNQICLEAQDVELSEYMDVGSMTKTPFIQYVARAGIAYREFFRPQLQDAYFANIKFVYAVMVAVGFALASVLVIRRFRTGKCAAAVLTLLFLAVPLAVNFIYVMADPDKVHSLMVYAELMPFVLAAWLIDRVRLRRADAEKILTAVCCALLLFLNLMFCRYDNICYLKATFSQQQAISYFTTLITQIKSADGYTDEMPVAFIDAREIQDKALYEIGELSDIVSAPYDGVGEYLNDNNWLRFVEIWCGYRPNLVGEEEVADLPEVVNMPSYPDDGSIQIVEGILVVKF